jgi:homoserine O-acetyltransferase
MQNIGALMFTLTLFVSILAKAQALSSEPQDVQQFADFTSCSLENGSAVAPCKIGYRTFGMLNTNADNAILIPTWFTGDSKGNSFMVSEDFIDPNHYFVVVVDAFGNGVSSSPSTSAAQPNEDFPLFSIRDLVDSQHRLLTEKLGVKKLHAVVGISMGGMQAFEWAVRYPDFSHKTAAIIGTPRLPAFDVALWETRNRLIELYRKCECDEALQALAGMGMLSSMPERLSANMQAADVVANMQKSAEEYFASPRQSYDSQRQAQAMLTHNIARDYEDNMQVAANRVKSEFLIIVGKDDRIVSPNPAIEFAKIKDAQILILDSGCGHGEVRCQPDVLAKTVQEFLEN